MRALLVAGLAFSSIQPGLGDQDSGRVEVTGQGEAGETALDREIGEFRAKHDAWNAVLINNAGGRAVDSEHRVMGAEGLGRLVSPVGVIIIAEAMPPERVVELYTSITKLPGSIHKVRILYTHPAGDAEPELLGYTLEDSDDVYTKLVKYDGKTPWLEWITKSFEKDDAEAAGKARGTAE